VILFARLLAETHLPIVLTILVTLSTLSFAFASIYCADVLLGFGFIKTGAAKGATKQRRKQSAAMLSS
jgi:hypothetical protein